MSDVDILLRIKDIINDGWCQGDWARNAAGFSVHTIDPTAVAWCLLGARNKATTELGQGLCGNWLRQAIMNHHSLATYNDTHSKQEVLDLVDRAIRLAKEAE